MVGMGLVVAAAVVAVVVGVVVVVNRPMTALPAHSDPAVPVTVISPPTNRHRMTS